MVQSIEVNAKNVNFFKYKICDACELEIPLEIGLILFYKKFGNHKFYYHEKCIPIKEKKEPIKKEEKEDNKKSYKLDENVINQLEEQSNINMLFMYERDKKIPPKLFRRLHKMGYLSYSRRLTDKALYILNKEKI
jgi:hypothetical protein